MSTVRVVLVDDHALVRGGLKMLIEAQPDMEVIGEAADAPIGLELIQRLQPDVALVDMNAPDFDNIEFAREVQRTGGSTQLLILTAQEGRDYLAKLLGVGSVRYVFKRSAVDELIQAVRTSAQEKSRLNAPRHDGSKTDGHATRAIDPLVELLSEREQEVVRLIAQGYSYKEIALRLQLSVKTVETYKARSMHKLQLRSRAALVRFAMEQGWLDDAS